MFFREWIALFCFFCFLVSLFVMGIFSSNSTVLSIEPCAPYKIQVEVCGGVERPGIYEVEVGSSIRSVLSLAGLKKEADRSRIYFKKKLLTSCQVLVPEKKFKKKQEKKRVFN